MSLLDVSAAVHSFSVELEENAFAKLFGSLDNNVSQTEMLSSQTSTPNRFLQPLWDLRIGREKYVQSPLFPIFVSIGFYFLTMIPWMIIDLYGQNWQWIRRYKIQPHKNPTKAEIWKAIKLTFRNQAFLIAPLSVVQYVLEPPTPLPAQAPDLFTFFFQIFGMMLVFDTEYFVWHMTHHKIRFLYRHVHSVHHEYYTPSSWVTQYLHPWELLSVGFYTSCTQWIFDAHLLTAIGFQIWSITASVTVHTGYDLPLDLHNFVPFRLWGGAPKHDMHHQRPRSNYAPFFRHWDWLFGSDIPPIYAGGRRPQELEDWEAKRRKLKSA